jgi:hypothetical protein
MPRPTIDTDATIRRAASSPDRGARSLRWTAMAQGFLVGDRPVRFVLRGRLEPGDADAVGAAITWTAPTVGEHKGAWRK